MSMPSSWCAAWLSAALLLASCSEPAASAGAAGSGTAAIGGGSGGAGGSSGAGGSGGAGTSGGAGGAAGAVAAGAGGMGGGASDAGGAVAMDGGAPADDAGSAPMNSECPSGAFCESFDDGDQLDAARWEIVAPNCMGTGSVAIDATQAHSGGGSLRVQGGAGYCNHVFARPKQAALSVPDPLYARFYVRLQSALDGSHVTFLALHDGSEDRDLRMGGQSEILMWNRESDDATLPELSPTGIALSVRPATERWLCIELMVGSAGLISTWVDGEAVAGLEVAGEPTMDVDAQWQRKADWHPMLQDVKLGWESYGDAANTLWFDELVIASERVGCL